MSLPNCPLCGVRCEESKGRHGHFAICMSVRGCNYNVPFEAHMPLTEQAAKARAWDRAAAWNMFHGEVIVDLKALPRILAEERAKAGLT